MKSKRIKFEEYIQEKYYSKRKMSLDKISPERVSPEKTRISIEKNPSKIGTKSLKIHTRKASHPHLNYKPVEVEAPKLIDLIPDEDDEYLKPLNILPIIW